MIGWLRRLFTEPTCPGCGREFVEWTGSWFRNGYREEQLWTGCPIYRDTKNPLDREKDRHLAYWRLGKRTPLREEKP